MYGNTIDEDEAYNKGVAFELKNDRETVKKHFAEWTTAKRIEEEKAKKKRY